MPMLVRHERRDCVYALTSDRRLRCGATCSDRSACGRRLLAAVAATTSANITPRGRRVQKHSAIQSTSMRRLYAMVVGLRAVSGTVREWSIVSYGLFDHMRATTAAAANWERKAAQTSSRTNGTPEWG